MPPMVIHQVMYQPDMKTFICKCGESQVTGGPQSLEGFFESGLANEVCRFLHVHGYEEEISPA